MADADYPLLLFSNPASAARSKLGGGAGRVKFPTFGRQQSRLSPQLATLQAAFDAKRLKLQQSAPTENPELILVFEIAGLIQDFARAVSKIQGLEWLLEWAEEFSADQDFYIEGKTGKPVSGRLFLIDSNLKALNQLLVLWDRYQKDPNVKFARGLAPFKSLFVQLRTIRPWSASDRLEADVREYWQNAIDDGLQTIRFEIEAWHYSSSQKNNEAAAEIRTLVSSLGGSVLGATLIPEIAYHGLLIEVPAVAIAKILAGEMPELVLSDRIMFFRPRAQSISDGIQQLETSPTVAVAGTSDRPPVVALLDGLPMQNHALLAGHVEIDDPDDWGASYEAKDRVHGTAMASLVLYGELDGTPQLLGRRLYVRPIMRSDLTDTFNQRRREHTPDDVLLIDLIHRAIKRICDADGDQPAVAPTVCVINISVCDAVRLFAREISPWARLLDWLAFRYSILIIVSAGNARRPLALKTPKDSLNGLSQDQRSALALSAVVADGVDRRLLAPSEAINVLTVGACHGDQAQLQIVGGRFDLFMSDGLSPLSRIGHGYRRGIKPEILMPGGRALYRERMQDDPNVSVVEIVSASVPPGHRVAMPPMPGIGSQDTGYVRGTSNAAALASRSAARAFDTIEKLRDQEAGAPGAEFDAVLLKALLVHGASWQDWGDRLLSLRPDLTEFSAKKDFVTRWLGYGFADVDRVLSCTAQRATLVGAGKVGGGDALIFSAPLPPSLAGKKVWRRLTVTLAWLSPINSSHHAYRRAKLWISPPTDQLRIDRNNSVHHDAARRGTVQHEILEGEEAAVFVDGDRLECKVNCAEDAGELLGKVPFALCVSLEVQVATGIPIYQEIRERIKPPVGIQQPIA